MAAQVRHLIQDENMNIHHKGRDANAAKAKKSAGLGGSKPLSNITNSGKPSPPKMEVKKSFLKNENEFEDQCQHNHKDSQTRVLIQNENFNTGCEGKSILPKSQKKAGIGGGKSILPKSQKKAGIGGGRKALSNITNSNKSSTLIPTRKNRPKKFMNIEEEQCLHNHQKCINSQTSGGVDMNLLLRTIGFEDDWASSPMFSVSGQAKGEIASSPPPRSLELEEITTELQNMNNSSPPRCSWTNMNNPFPSPSPNRFFSTPKLALRPRDF